MPDVLLMLLASAAASQPTVGLPFRHGSLAACAPKSLEAAEECLTKALSKEDFAKLLDRTAANPFRGALDFAIETEWRLGDPSSTMAKVMREKIGIDQPAIAASMIIQDIQMRAVGPGLPWEEVRKDMARIPTGAHTTTCPKLSTNITKTSLSYAH